MSRLLIWRGCVDLASDGIIPNVRNIRKWLAQTHQRDDVENIDEEINSWFCCLFKQISAAATSSPFLDSAHVDLIRQEAIDSALLSVKIQIESVKNKQFKINAKLNIENKWAIDTQSYKRKNEIELKQQQIEAAQEHVQSLVARNENLTEALFFARSRIQAVINVLGDKDLLIEEKEVYIALLNRSIEKIESEKLEIVRELQQKTWRLDSAVLELLVFRKAAEWQRDKDFGLKEEEIRRELLIKKLKRRIEFLEKKLVLKGEAPNYPIDLFF